MQITSDITIVIMFIASMAGLSYVIRMLTLESLKKDVRKILVLLEEDRDKGKKSKGGLQ